MQRYKSFLDVLDRVIRVITATAVAVMTTLMVYQVILRYCFHNSNSWSEELVRYMFAWVIMLGGCIAIRRNSHLKVDVFLSMMKPQISTVLQIVMYTMILMFLGVLFVLGINLVMKTTGTLSNGTKVPMAVPYACIPTGAFFMMLTSVEYIFDQVNNLRQLGKENEE